MPVPSHQQVIDALAARSVPLECRSCNNATALKLDVAGINLTTLGKSAVNSNTTTVRHMPMVLLTCGACGDTRLFHLETLGFRPPY